jgi:peptide/nickel transport system permease protein
MRFPLLLLFVVMGLALFAPVLAPADPMQASATHQLQAPNSAHLFGTDLLGRDVLSRLLYGGRRTLAIAALGTTFSVLLGTILGVLAGIMGSKVNGLITMTLDALLAFPSLVFALAVLTLLGPGTLPLAFATGMAQIASFARVIRSAVIRVRSLGYVEVAEAAGATRFHILSAHILPNIRETLLGYTGVVFSYSILNGAALTFLGLGGEPGIPDWGVMLSEGRATFRVAPWVSLVPGLAITVTVWSVNRIADLLISQELK